MQEPVSPNETAFIFITGSDIQKMSPMHFKEFIRKSGAASSVANICCLTVMVEVKQGQRAWNLTI